MKINIKGIECEGTAIELAIYTQAIQKTVLQKVSPVETATAITRRKYKKRKGSSHNLKDVKGCTNDFVKVLSKNKKPMNISSLVHKGKFSRAGHSMKLFKKWLAADERVSVIRIGKRDHYALTAQEKSEIPVEKRGVGRPPLTKEQIAQGAKLTQAELDNFVGLLTTTNGVYKDDMPPSVYKKLVHHVGMRNIAKKIEKFYGLDKQIKIANGAFIIE